jgi:MoaA/NifB/PqqE/SkfB family radical SAM enzyme
MIEKILTRFLSRNRKAFSAWQIELTTRCPLRCKMCIRTESPDWQYQDMSLQDFHRILPYLGDVETVVLEGWGESLLHPDLAECIRLVRKAGPRVGFVTCGMGLTVDRVTELIEAGLDFVGFSISGISPETHDAIRVHSRLSEIMKALDLFSREIRQRQTLRPQMHIVFLMLKQNIGEVPRVPSFASEMGIEQVILTNVCHTITSWQDEQKVFLWGSDKNPYENMLKQAKVNAQRLKVRMQMPSLSAGQVSLCEENPLRNLYISADGEVSPCVYLHPPLPSPFKRIFCGKEYRTEKISFGNVFREPFSAIWKREAYVQFRNRFAERESAMKNRYLSLWDKSTWESSPNTPLPVPPEACETCHKLLGV